MSSSQDTVNLYFCCNGEWVQRNTRWNFVNSTNYGVNISSNVTHRKLLGYAIKKCRFKKEAVSVTRMVHLVDGYLAELSDDEQVSMFMDLAAQSDTPLSIIVYVVPVMYDEGDEEEGGDDGGDEAEGGDDGGDEEEGGDDETQFAGCADDETHVFSFGLSDEEEEPNEDDDAEAEPTYVTQESFSSGINDYFDMPPPPLPTPETCIETYPQAPYNRSTRVQHGQLFDTKDEMIGELGWKFLEEGFEFKIKRSDPSRFEAVCIQQGCEWRMTATGVGPRGGMFHVRVFDDLHTCSRSQLNPRHRNANKKVLGHILKGKFADESRSYRPNDIVNDINLQFGVTISYHQAWRARCRSLLLVRGTPEESFARLPVYLYNLELHNPGTVTSIKRDRCNRFEACFVALGVSIRTFLSNLRKVVIMDAAHLKGTYLGTMFLAVAMDGNDHIVPIAFGVGRSETGDEWNWFLSRLKECIGSPEGLVFMSDRASSISSALSTVYRGVPHALCCRHLEMNAKSADKRVAIYKTTYWKVCRAYTVREFDRYMNALRVHLPEAARVMDEAGKERWSMAHFPAVRYNILTSNSVESVNALSRYARRCPIVGLLEYFREFQQQWYLIRRQKGG